MTVSVTSDFKHAYESDRRDRMRRRFLKYTIIMGVLQILLFALIWEVFDLSKLDLQRVGLGVVTLFSAFVFFGAHVFVKNASSRLSRGAIVWLAIGLLITAALLRLPHTLFGVQETDVSPAVAWSLAVVFSHTVTSFFIPWTAREALIPMGIVLVVLSVLGFLSDGLLGIVRAVFVSGLLAAPGTLIAWASTSQYRQRFQNRFLRSSYTSMKRELVDARRIHEDLFPDPIEDGPIRVRYEYEPMSQIGGDYLFVRNTPTSTTAVLIDVTGHGIAAALTINRLQGEIQRTLGERPDLGPGELLVGLNRYIHLTLATHSVYATAWCCRVEHDSQTLEYASAGHPPAFLIGVDNSIERLDSTTFMLGVTHGDDFVPNEITCPFHEGDTLIAYTDGATEAMNIDGRMLGVMGFLRSVASITPDELGWPKALRAHVDAYRDGPPADDTLIVEVARPFADAATD